MISRTFIRFVAGALVLILVAVIAGLAHLRPAAIIVVMLLAWVVVAALEWVATRSGGRAPAAAERSVRMSEVPRPPENPLPPVPAAAADNPFAALAASLDEEELEWQEAPEEPVQPEPQEQPPAPVPEEPAAAEVEPRPLRKLWRQLGRGRGARPDRPARERSVRREPPGRPSEGGDGGEIELRPCATCGKPISSERLKALPDAVQCIDCKRAGRPAPGEDPASAVALEPAVPLASEPEPEPETTPAPVLSVVPAPEPEPSPPMVEEDHSVVRLPVRAEPREWNLWELEQKVRERAGRSAGRDEEWGFLLVYLREFASPDGRLPADFDDLVRESFSELIGQ